MLRGGDSNVKKYNTVSRRIFILSIAKGVIFTGIIAKLFSLQINENKKYLTLSDKNRIREWKLPPTRGNIVDYFGNIIAGNLKVYQLHIIPKIKCTYIPFENLLRLRVLWVLGNYWYFDYLNYIT